jgi:Rps23 Pro-64 3,4-dihydroxylase Tpa1-like proline 4-hydroxylase
MHDDTNSDGRSARTMSYCLVNFDRTLSMLTHSPQAFTIADLSLSCCIVTFLSAYSHAIGPVKPTDRHRAAVHTGGHIEKGNSLIKL